MISQVLSLGLGYIIRLVIARSISVSEYGLYSAVFGLIGFFLIFRDLGFGTAINKLVPELKVKSKKNNEHTILAVAIVIQLIFSTIISILLFFTKDFFAKYFFKEESAALLILIFIGYIYFSVIAIWIKIVFRAYKRDFLYSMMEPLRNIINLILLFAFLKFFDGAIVPTLAISVSWMLVSFIVIPWLIKTHNIFQKWTKIKENVKKLITLGTNVMFNDFADRMITRIDVLTLTFFTTLEKVGIYSAVYPTSFLFSIFGRSIFPIILPHISMLKLSNNHKSLESFLKITYKYTMIFTLPLILISIVFAKEILRILFGQDYVSGYIAFIILLFGALMNSFVLVNNAFLIGFDKIRITSKIITFALIFNFVGNILVIPIIGIEGASITSSISYALMFFASTFYLNKEINIKIPYYDWGKLALVSTIIVLIAIYFNHMLHFNIFIKIITLSIIILITYTILVYIFKLINIKEFKNLLKIVRNKKVRKINEPIQHL